MQFFSTLAFTLRLALPSPINMSHLESLAEEIELQVLDSSGRDSTWCQVQYQKPKVL